SFGGFPSLTGFEKFYRIQVTLEGIPDSHTSYLRNIKEIDAAVRDKILKTSAPLTRAPQSHFNALSEAFAPATLYSVTLWLTPFLSVAQYASEYPMTRLSQKFEFSAAHRLHNPKLSDEQNQKVYGKCNNPNGH